MNQVVFVILSVILLKVVDGQILTPCQRAEQDLENNPICEDAIDTNNATLVCNGTCRGLYDAVIGVCGGTTRYRVAIYSLCDPCGIPQTALSLNDNCSDALLRGIPAVLCMGICRELSDDIIQNCDNASGTGVINTLDRYCTPCGMAEANLQLDFFCWSEIRSFNPDTAEICTGACRTLVDDAINNCDTVDSSNYANTISSLCGGGTNTNMECENAANAVDDSCKQLLSTANPTVCSGTCETQLSRLVTACGSNNDPEIRGLITAYNTACLSGTACRAALTAWHTSTTCLNAIDTGDTATYCSGACAELIDDIINTCPSVSFANDISDNCANALCEAAANAVNGSCLLLLNTANPTACFGMCGSQVALTADACTSVSDSEIQEFVAAYNTACLSEAVCRATLTAWNANATCVDAVNNDNTAIYCSETCGELIRNVLNTCPNNDFLSNYKQACGFGSGGDSILQASGIIVLLFVTMCGLIF